MEGAGRADGVAVVIPQSYLDQPRWWSTGADWLAHLPDAVHEQCREWDLTVDGPVQHGSNAVVVPVVREGESLMLRMTPPGPAASAEIEALRFWRGQGVVRLLDAAPGPAAMLLERILPGTSARALPVAECMDVLGRAARRLAVPTPRGVTSTAEIAAARLLTMSRDWTALGRPFTADVLHRAEQACAQLSTADLDVAVNGDLHADQVLQAMREPWLVIDPVLDRGDIAYDFARCLWTRLDEMRDDAEILRHLSRLARAAELDQERTRLWVTFRAVDYWLWGLAAGLTEDPPRCARLVHALGS